MTQNDLNKIIKYLEKRAVENQQSAGILKQLNKYDRLDTKEYFVRKMIHPLIYNKIITGEIE